MATIGIDASALSVSACGGIGISQYQTMRALAELETPHRFVLYAASPLVVPFSRQSFDLPWQVRVGSGPLALSNIVWMQTGVNRLLAEDHVDVFWGPRHLLPFRVRSVSRVATVHDFWGWYYPRQQPWPNRIVNHLMIARVLAHADVVVSPSVATARDAERFGSVVPGSVRVVPWGVDPAVFRPLPAERIAAVLARVGIKSPYLLSLDVFNPRKNFSAVIEGVSRLPEETRRALTVVGIGRPRRTAARVDPAKKAEALGQRGRVCLLGDVGPEDLVALYSGALALVYPSLFEGFGMPVLEAMACGCPVITGDRSSLPEVAGDAALLVDPASTEQLAQAIALVATDTGERVRLVGAGRARAEGFTWRRTAQGMMEAFESALAAHARSAQ
jgi:glycosyltransferase involved in cell wall biosynthesis